MSSNRIAALLRQLRTAAFRFLYRVPRVHPTFTLSRSCDLRPDFEAGESGYMGYGCMIAPRVRAGRYVMFGARVTIVGADHRFDVPGTPMIFSGRPKPLDTVIEDDVWIGGGSTILVGITIGRGSIIATGAVVTRDVPPYSIVAGIPARVLRKRFENPEDERRHDEMLASGDFLGRYADSKQ